MAIWPRICRYSAVFRARLPGEQYRRLPVPLITNVMGSSAEELGALVDACEQRAEIAAIELNVSCPNVKTGLDIGADPALLEHVARGLPRAHKKPLIVKLTPNTADVAACALAAEAGGADAVSLINTLRAMALEPVARARRSRGCVERACAGSAQGLARRRNRRALGAGDPQRRARSGRSGRCARGHSGDRHGRRAERGACARAARSRSHARRGRHRELSRPDRRRERRAERSKGESKRLRSSHGSASVADTIPQRA